MNSNTSPNKYFLAVSPMLSRRLLQFQELKQAACGPQTELFLVPNTHGQ